MIEINLLPQEMRKKETLLLMFPEIPVRKTLILSFSLLMGLQILAGFFVLVQRWEWAHVKREAAILKERNKDVFARKAEWTRLRKRTQQLETLTHRKFYWTRVLDALTQSMTKGVWLRGLSLTDDGKGLELEGSVLAQGQETATIGKFIKGLKEHPQFSALFDDVRLSNMNQKKIKESDAYDFTIVGLFKNGKI